MLTNEEMESRLLHLEARVEKLESSKKEKRIVAEDYKDEFFDQAVSLLATHSKISASFLQRKLGIGYARAARIADDLYVAGFLGPADGSKPRNVIKKSE